MAAGFAEPPPGLERQPASATCSSTASWTWRYPSMSSAYVIRPRMEKFSTEQTHPITGRVLCLGRVPRSHPGGTASSGPGNTLQNEPICKLADESVLFAEVLAGAHDKTPPDPHLPAQWQP